MADYSLLRLYLADQTEPYVFEDAQLQVLLDESDSDVASAAAKGWSIKASTVAEWYDVSLDGSSLSRGDVFDHCMEMAEHYSGGVGTGGASLKNVALEGPSKPQTDTESEFA